MYDRVQRKVCNYSCANNITAIYSAKHAPRGVWFAVENYEGCGGADHPTLVAVPARIICVYNVFFSVHFRFAGVQ